jgi:predicted DCC family thiol-disulfide oxidoreductase YuxK
MTKATYSIPEHLVLFDGVCNLCNSSVDFIMRNDRKNKIVFASLQSPQSVETLKEFNFYDENLSTIVYLRHERIHIESSAVIMIAKDLGLPWSLSYILIIVPPVIRNFFYKWVSRNRYKWFGKKDTCRLPTPEEKAKFIWD